MNSSPGGAIRFDLMTELNQSRWTARWPENDRRLWHLAFQQFPFSGEASPRFVWRPATFQWVAKSYVCWLIYLEGKGWLDVSACPGRRVTPSRLRSYVRDCSGDFDQQRC
jgi:hypothetical protein